MAIYHLEAKIVSRGAGRSAVAAAAYLSCSRMLNEYDGVQHDYTRKQGLGWRQVFLPATAPAEWQDRETLWNAVEETETAKDSRLAREFVAALPIELSREEQIQLLQDFIKEQFVADGMCADAAIHDPYPPGHNPHAHILLTVRPLDEKGKWQYKTEKEYLCVKGGEERGFTAAEFKQAQADGWEKQYQYKVGKKKVYMAPSAAQAQGYERVSKYPKSTKYGRQNPITERWNSDEQLVLWRAAWADVANRYLERTGHEERIDHRSHAERGLLERPTVHEGVVARAIEKKGIISDRCELNRQIKADNALLRELRGQVKKLAQAVKNTIPALAEAMENLRKNLLLFCYQLGYLRKGKERLNTSLNTLRPALAQYNQLAKDIRDKTKERRSLLSEKKSLSAVHVFRHRELAAKIAALTEDLEELRSEKNLLLASLAYTEEDAADKFPKDIAAMEQSLKRLEEQEQKYQRKGTFANIYANAPEGKAYAWTIAQVKSILEDETYIENSVHYRETNISNKNKKRIRKDPSEWVRVEGTHEAIISKDVFDRVQEQIATRRRSMKDQTTQIFSRLLKCAGCGWSMRFRTKRQIKKPYRHYDCSRYGQLGNQCSAHYVRYDVL